MLVQNLLIVMRTVLAAAVAVENATTGWRSQGNGHLQRPDRQTTFHAITDGPTEVAPFIWTDWRPG